MTRINLNFAFFVFVFLSVFTYSSSFAQLKEGTFVINERFDFYTDAYESSQDDYSSERKVTRYNLTTSFGYLFKENQEIGMSVSFGRDKQTQTNVFQGGSTNSDYTYKNYGFGIYYKKYVNIVEKLSFFVSPQLSYSNGKVDREVNPSTKNQIGANIYTGLLYHPTKRFGLSMNLLGAGINYSSRKEEDVSNVKQTSFFTSDFGGLNLALQFML
ncbi:hypothetical protein ACE193_20115 [Bernardetia sp. OM2101]|uniref:hypothetical protein n=1 Tax=Bernardetia sp. OM2101 TaxID=3344876 RepID=UPI0035CF5ADD